MNELRTSFHQKLADLSANVNRLGFEVVDLIPRTTRALLDSNLADASEIMAIDGRINIEVQGLEERAITIIALEGPVAIDLRRLVATLRIIDEVGRSADLLANICKANRRLYGHSLAERIALVISAMSEQASLLYRSAIESFVDQDAVKASLIDEMDSYLDALQRQFVQTIFDVHADGELQLEEAVQFAMIARFYERIGDHAVNIAGRVMYLVTGELPEHKGAELYRIRGTVPKPEA